ncbi:MAG: sacsin N-terminal ATP-binding-like domain-containing protein [Desulfomonilaceae bacterium]
MRHYESDQVSYIRDLLYEDYPLSSVFKELIQNAQDAGAQQLHFGWIADWPDDVHPLLRQPVLFALNDGGFSKIDYKSIGYIGSSAKGNDAGSIGTFGFGMKSVFHFCEAFLYAASPNQEASDGQTLIEVVTPWPKGTPNLDDWEIQESSRHLIMDRLDLWVRQCPRWFCVMIPLRTEQQLLNRESIKPFFRRIQDFFPDKPSAETLCLTPLLKSLEKVTFWGWNSQTFSPEKKWCMFLDSKGLQRTRSLDDLKRTTPSPIGGTLYVSTAASEEASLQHRFSGDEILLPPAEFDELKKKREWPRTKNLKTSETAQYVPRNGEPHCAVLFSTNESALNQNPQLQIDRAVFLPLAQMEESVPCRGNRDYRMILHGWYFLDKGRTKVLERVELGREIEEQWNKLIDKNGLWPMILPSLNKFVRETNLNADEINGLTEALRQSDIFRSHKEFICREHQWLRQISDQNCPSGQWRLVEGSKSYLRLPEPDNGNTNLPFQVFPNLPTISAEHVLVFAEQPSLTTKEPGTWDYGRASDLLQNMGTTALESDQGMQYLVSFLKSLGNSLRESLAAVYARSVMRLIKDIEIDKVRPHKNYFFELLDQLPPKNRISVNLSQDLLAKLVHILGDLDLNQILLPNSFHTDKLEWGKIKQSTSEKMLKWLADDSNWDVQERNEAALAIIEKTEGILHEKQKKFGHYKLFGLVDYCGTFESKASWNELSELSFKGLLCSTASIEKSIFIEPLKKAIFGERFWILCGSNDLKPFWILFEKHDRLFHKKECVEVLCRRPLLASPEDRKFLLDTLLGSIKDSYEHAQVIAIRYLLHDNKDQYDDTVATLWIDSNYGNDNIQKRLAREALLHLPNQWSIVPQVLAEVLNEHLNQRQKKQLNIQQIDPSQLEDLLRKQRDFRWIVDMKLSRDERWEVLRIIRDDEIFKSLPIHETIDGRLISLNSSNIFLISRDNFRVSPNTESLVTLLERPGDDHAEDIYQNRRIQEWTPQAAIQIALEAEAPSWEDILDGLRCLQRKPDDRAYRELIDRCKKRPWLPTLDGPRAPQYLVNREDKTRALSLMLSAENLTEIFFGVERILPKCREHAGYERMIKLLAPSDEETLEHIGGCLKKTEKYAIGDLSQRIDKPDFLDNFRLVFTQFPTNVTPTGSIVKVLLEVGYQPNGIKDRILRPLAKAVSGTRLKQFLISFITIHEQANEHAKRKIMDVFNWYLDLYAENAAPEDLSDIFFLNKEGVWKSSREIALDVHGIARSELIHEGQVSVLEPLIKRNSLSADRFRENKFKFELSNLDFRQYFTNFEGHVAERTIGAFLGILGKEKLIEERAKYYLGSEDLELFRTRIDWSNMGAKSKQTNTQHYETFKDTMSKNTLKFYHSLIPKHPNHHYLPSITGTSFQAREDQDNETIFVGDFPCEFQDGTGHRIVYVTLRRLTQDFLEKINVQELLVKSALYILRCVYRQQPKNLNDLFDPGNEEQLDLRVAQQLILKHSMFYFKQLPSKYLTELQQFLDEWGKLEKLESQIKIFGSKGVERRETDIAGEEERLLEDLCDKLENEQDESGVQRQLLEAVRHKIEEHYQYTPDSIPFELFQNADDASAELLQMKGSELPIESETFHMSWGYSRIIFAHSGRSINFYKKAMIRDRETENVGYDRDLEKMLVMSYSDKGQRQDHVTGKFGLGFKSVFIVSERPKVLSGLLGFQVLAGMYPRRLRQDDRLRLKEILERKIGNPHATIFEIGFDKTLAHSPRKVNERFLKLLPVILVFSRQIKRCVLEDERGSEETLVHSEEPISNCPGAFVTNLRFPFDGDMGDCNALVLRIEDFSALLLKLNPKGIGKFPEKLPTFWDLGPLGKEGLGFALNGNFLLDVGRAQIAEPIERHEEVSKELGCSLGEVLIRMHATSKSDWPSLRQSLGFSTEVTAYQMWESIWKLLGSDLANENSGQKRERDLCKQIFWQTERGMAKLFETEDAIPSGLYGNYERLTNLKNIGWCTTGILDLDKEVFNAVSGWEDFRQHIPCNQNKLVSESRIKLPLECLTSTKYEWNRVDIKSALMWEVKRYPRIFPEQAEKLGTLITRNFMDGSEKNNDSNASITEELELLREYLGDLQFRTDAGGFVRCQDILVSDHEETEESRKAAFAPPELVLDSTYGKSGIEFFRACRGSIPDLTEKIKDWALKAQRNSQQKAFLTYLSRDGEGSQDLLRLIGDVSRKSWLQMVTETQAYKELDPYDRYRLNFKIGVSESLESDEDESEEEPDIGSRVPVPVFPTHDSLEKIFYWWERKRGKQLGEYERKIYPDGEFFLRDHKSCSDENRKKKWLKMFLLACLQTMGLASHKQKKEFLKRSDSLIGELVGFEGNPRAWLQSFDQLIERQIHDFRYYNYYLRLFGIYVVGRRLTDYIELVEKVDDRPHEKPISMRQILIPRISEDLQGGGLDAPPINRVLGIGAHFLFRELRRNGILGHPGLNKLCYVPNEKLRILVETLGCRDINGKDLTHETQSGMISDFLTKRLGPEKALFKTDFDIPMQMIAYDSQLQAEVLGYQLPVKN